MHGGADALTVALDVYAHPAKVAYWRTVPLPPEVGTVLRIASGQSESVAEASRRHSVEPEQLIASSRFFIEQLMLARDVARDPWRVLGVGRDAPDTVLRENRHWLLRLVHPDRSQDWADAYASRVHEAWRAVRSGAAETAPELRDGGEQEAPRGESWPQGEAEDDWAPSGAPSWVGPPGQLTRVPMPEVPPPRSRAARMAHRTAWVAAVALVLMVVFAGPAIEEAFREDQAMALGGGFADLEAPPSLAPTQRDPESMAGQQPSLGQASSEGPPPIEAPQPMDGLGADHAQGLNTEVVPRAPKQTQPELVADAPLVAATTPACVGANCDGSATPTAAAQRRAPRPDAPVQLPAQPRTKPTALASSPKLPTASTNAAAQPGDAASSTAARVEPAPAQRPSGGQEPGVSSPPVTQAKPPVAVAALQDPPKRVAPARGEEGRGPVAATQSPAPGTGPAAASAKPQAATGTVAASAPTTQRASSVPAPAARRAPTIAEVDRLIGDFQSAYTSADLTALLSLFTSDAHVNRGGKASLAADYGTLFRESNAREIAFRGLRWQVEGRSLVGRGGFEARIDRPGRVFKQRVQGSVRLEVVHERDGARFRWLEPLRSSDAR